MDVCSREYAAPETNVITREFGVVVKVSDLHSPVLDSSDGGSGPVGPQIFFLEKKVKKRKKKPRNFSFFPFPPKE